MTKATDKRAQQGFERTRSKLKIRELELATAERTLKREREELRRERANTIALLQVLCEQYGDPKWDATMAVPDIIERYLMDPIIARVSQRVRTASAANRTPTARATPTQPVPPPQPRPQQPPPQPLRPTPVPHVPHKSMVVRGQARNGPMGYVARCMRGCRSEVWPTEQHAIQAGYEHDARFNEGEGASHPSHLTAH